MKIPRSDRMKLPPKPAIIAREPTRGFDAPDGPWMG
mgnify:CR=1 FL=1